MGNKDLRRYTHNCPKHKGKEIALRRDEICPECGQTGRHNGWNRGMYSQMSMAHDLTGVPQVGIQRRFLPQMAKVCENCGGDGLVTGSFDEDDYDCPVCNGLGGILILNDAEMEKIQRWAVGRHKRSLHEDESEWNKKPVPADFVLSKNSHTFVDAMMAMVKDWQKNGERNKRIGELMLRANHSGWVVLMELVEKWEKLGGRLSAQNEQIILTTPGRNGIRLGCLQPGKGSGNGQIRLRWKGLEKHIPDRKKIVTYQNEITRIASGQVERDTWLVDIPDNMGLEAAWAYLRAMRKLGEL